jgi:hypothetical protein
MRKGIIVVTTDGRGIITVTIGGDDTRIAHGQDPATIGTDMDIFPE